MDPAPAALLPPRRRGRPSKHSSPHFAGTQERLLRHGLVTLTEKGFAAVSLDEILSAAGVPKGSFYHYFPSKEAFGLALIDHYADYFAHKLERSFAPDLSGLSGLQRFVDDACAGMARHAFKRGCLVGNLGQEMGSLPETFRARLIAVLQDWQHRTAQCLRRAQTSGELPAALDCDQLAAVFWTGWEGAVLRAKLERSAAPLELFAQAFFALLAGPPGAEPPSKTTINTKE